MSANVTVIAGPARSGKTSRLLAAYRRELAAGKLGTALWLCPTHRSAAGTAAGLLDGTLPGCISPNLLTFDELARRVLAAAAPRLRPLTPLLVRSLIKDLIDENTRAGRLDFFAPIAATRGFFDLVVGFIRQLKRLEIWPEEWTAAHEPGGSEKDRELGRLYEQYQAILVRHDLYDPEGQFWAARALLRDGAWGPLASVEHVFVDGFTDFTRTEHEVLELLATCGSSLSISLAWEPQTDRSELFTKTSRTLEELSRRYPALAVENLPRRGDEVAALAHLERHLFANPRSVPPLVEASGVEVVAAAGVTHEIEWIAQRVKGLLSGRETGAPVAPTDILIVFRSLAEAAGLVREVFSQFGIPVATLAAPPLASAPIVQALVAWLRLDAEDWPFRRVLAVLAHNYFHPRWPEWRGGQAAVALEHLVRELQIPSGRGDLVDGIERLAARAAAEAGAKQRLSAVSLRAEQAAGLLRKIGAALDRLPNRATLGEWSTSLEEFAREVGMFDAAEHSPLGSEAAAADRIAWQRLASALGEIERLARWLDRRPPRMSRAEFLDLLTDLLSSETLPLSLDETPCVRVLSAEAARTLSAPYVFVAGLSEQAFPPPRLDDCIFTDAERRRLAARGLPLPSQELDNRFEMLLFYEVVTRATRRLVLSYPGLDPAAQPLRPSPYLSDVERACGDALVKRSWPVVSSVPADADVRRARDFRVRAVAQAIAGEGSMLAELGAHSATRHAADSIRAALRMSLARFRGESFGPFEGILTSAAAAAKLAERFGPDRCWTASQLEQYAYCPFQFFLARVLGVSPVAEPQLADDYLERGQLLHDLLAAAHRHLNARAGEPSSPATHELAHFASVVGALVERSRGGRDRALETGLREVNARKVLSWIARYHQQHAEYDRHFSSWEQPPRPAHFEVSFGPARGDEETGGDEAEPLLEGADPLSSPAAFELDCAGETIRLAGRIDRIDVGRVGGRAVFTIVDYKSGTNTKRSSKKAIYEFSALQLPLYALAAEWLLSAEESVPLRAAYWHVALRGYQDKDALKFHEVLNEQLSVHEDWQALESQLRARVRSLVEGIRSGQFPMFASDDDCTGRCPFNTVCRVNQVRALEKTWRLPGEESP